MADSSKLYVHPDTYCCFLPSQIRRILESYMRPYESSDFRRNRPNFDEYLKYSDLRLTSYHISLGTEYLVGMTLDPPNSQAMLELLDNSYLRHVVPSRERMINHAVYTANIELLTHLSKGLVPDVSRGFVTALSHSKWRVCLKLLALNYIPSSGIIGTACNLDVFKALHYSPPLFTTTDELIPKCWMKNDSYDEMLYYLYLDPKGRHYTINDRIITIYAMNLRVSEVILGKLLESAKISIRETIFKDCTDSMTFLNRIAFINSYGKSLDIVVALINSDLPEQESIKIIKTLRDEQIRSIWDTLTINPDNPVLSAMIAVHKREPTWHVQLHPGLTTSTAILGKLYKEGWEPSKEDVQSWFTNYRRTLMGENWIEWVYATTMGLYAKHAKTLELFIEQYPNFSHSINLLIHPAPKNSHIHCNH